MASASAAVLLGSIESTVVTDFALLYVNQGRVRGEAEADVYAATAPGEIALQCGTKYARPTVRVERWDAEPPPVDRDWEDVDELPFAEIPGAGGLQVAGFDPPGPDEPALDVTGLGRARAQVLARGRHDQHYSTEEIEHPEQWLVRLWPDPDEHDALWGPPRRVGGGAHAGASPGSGWGAALGAWRLTGWQDLLMGVAAYDRMSMALTVAGRPLTPDELLASMRPYAREIELSQPPSWDTPAIGIEFVPEAIDLVRGMTDPKLTALARMSGRATIETFGDVLAAMLDVGLLAVTEGHHPGRLVPNPAPPAIWDLDPQTAADPRTRLWAEHRHQLGAVTEINHLVRWAPGRRLTTRPLDIAVRLSAAVSWVIGGIRFLPAFDWVHLVDPVEELTPRTEITLEIRPRDHRRS